LGHFAVDPPRRSQTQTKPGDELQVVGKMGRLLDPATSRQRDCQALIFTPVVSRYNHVWRALDQGTCAMAESRSPPPVDNRDTL
jgi:hypothetical protein